MKILGIDHATVHGGIALLDDGQFDVHDPIDLRDFTAWSPMYAMAMVVDTYIEQHRPHYVALEKPMALRNGDVARKLIEVYAACKMAAEHRSVPIIDITPQLAKMYTAGHGKAEKDDVARALQARYALEYDQIAVPVYYKDKKRAGQVRERLYDVSDACALCVAAFEIKSREAVAVNG